MKTIFIITCFDRETLKYTGTLNIAFETKELAKGYARACNEAMHYAIREVPFLRA